MGDNMKKVRACSFCGSMRIQGIYILNQWMCRECEEELLKSDLDHPSYQENVSKIKNVWKNHCVLSKKG